MPEQRSEEKRQRTTDRQVSAVKRHEWAVRTTERQGASVAKGSSEASPRNSLPIVMPGASTRGNLATRVYLTKNKHARSEADYTDALQLYEASIREYERLFSELIRYDEGATYDTYLDKIAWRGDLATFFGAVLLGAAVLFVFAANDWIPSSAYLIGGVLVMLWGCLAMLGRTAIRDRRRRQTIRAIMKMNRQSRQPQT